MGGKHGDERADEATDGIGAGCVGSGLGCLCAEDCVGDDGCGAEFELLCYHTSDAGDEVLDDFLVAAYFGLVGLLLYLDAAFGGLLFDALYLVGFLLRAEDVRVVDVTDLRGGVGVELLECDSGLYRYLDNGVVGGVEEVVWELCKLCV